VNRSTRASPWAPGFSPSFVARLAAAVLGSLAGLSPVHAELIATPLRGDTRLVQFQYDPDNTFLVLSRPRAVTHIQFAPDEVIRSIASGDSQQWSLEPTRDRRHLFVKPVHDDIETSLTVLTDQRSYQFVLRSTGEGRKWYQRVNWLYPARLVVDLATGNDDPSPAAAAGTAIAAPASVAAPAARPMPADAGPAIAPVRPDQLRFGYEIEGEAAFRPERAFDDGRFTYVQMPRGLQELPALLIEVDDAYALSNYELRGPYLVVQRLFDRAVLRLGRREVRLWRQAEVPAPPAPVTPRWGGAD
jgi:type IV secretion system protein TrbG